MQAGYCENMIEPFIPSLDSHSKHLSAVSNELLGRPRWRLGANVAWAHGDWIEILMVTGVLDELQTYS